MLSHLLSVIGLVGHYPTNYLMEHKFLPFQPDFYIGSLLVKLSPNKTIKY